MTPLILAAPLQGLTEAAWRRAHRASPWRADYYYTPFIRLEGGEPRRKELRDLDKDAQAIPQIIFRNINEFSILVNELVGNGYCCIDLNLGCPFPPQVKKGRGAGLLTSPEELSAVCEFMHAHRELNFSIKMRPGVESSDDWKGISSILNKMPLKHIAIHPRLIRNPYDGPLLLETFEEMAGELHHPIIYNGSLECPADIDRIIESYPNLYGLMIGRGLIARPTLIEEWRRGGEMSAAERGRALLRINGEILNEYCQSLCGDTQILQKIKPYWEMAPEEIVGRKMLKAIKKASSLEKLMALLN